MSKKIGLKDAIGALSAYEVIAALSWFFICIFFLISSLSFPSGHNSLAFYITRNTSWCYVIPWIMLAIYRIFCFKLNTPIINTWYASSKIIVCVFFNIALFVYGSSYGKDYRAHVLIMNSLNYIIVSCTSSILCKQFNNYGNPKDFKAFIPGAICIMISLLTYFQAMNGWRSYMQYTDYSSVAVWAYTGLVAFIVSLISTIRSFLSTQISSEKSVSFPGISPLGQRAKIKQFQRAYLAREVFLKKKDQNKKAYNLALLLDMCNANNAKELMKDLMSDTEAQRKAIFKSRKMIYEPVVKNPFLKGESFILGRYMYGKNKSVKPIEWIVIDVRDDSLLLLSKYALDKKQYAKNEGSNHTWSASFIRDWLNHSFYDSSFTTKEKEIIQETKIQSFPSTHTAASRYRPSNLDYNSDIEATIDKVFLLDAKEVELVPIKERTAKPTPYFESQFFDCVTDYSVGSYSDHPKYARNWILRNLSYSPRFSSWWYPDEVEFDTLSKQAIVKEALNISSEATIRPAIIVSLRPGEIRT